MTITIVTGDALEILRAERGKGAFADVTITDPPYTTTVHETMAKKGTLTNGRLGKIETGFRPFNALGSLDLDGLAWVQDVLASTRRWSSIFCAIESLGDYQRAAPDHYIRGGLYIKGKAMPQITGDRPGNRAEGIAILHGPGRKRWNGRGTAALWIGHPPNRKETMHPTAKPLHLIMRMIELFSDPGEVIFDPFAGSGNHAIAAHALGRSYLGIEINPTHADNARARVASADYGAILKGFEEYKSKYVGPGSALIADIADAAYNKGEASWAE